MQNYLKVAKQGSMDNQVAWLSRYGDIFWDIVCQMPIGKPFKVTDIPYDSLTGVTPDQFRRRCSLVLNNVIAEYEGKPNAPVVRKGNRYWFPCASED